MQAGQAPCGLSDCADATGYDAVKNEYELMFLDKAWSYPGHCNTLLLSVLFLSVTCIATERSYVPRTVQSLIFVINMYIRLRLK
jgi:hypothetical protein